MAKDQTIEFTKKSNQEKAKYMEILGRTLQMILPHFENEPVGFILIIAEGTLRHEVSSLPKDQICPFLIDFVTAFTTQENNVGIQPESL